MKPTMPTKHKNITPTDAQPASELGVLEDCPASEGRLGVAGGKEEVALIKGLVGQQLVDYST
jgi:hypothetical protein